MPRAVLAILLLLATPISPAAPAAGNPAIHRVFRSTDHGHSWSRSDTGLPPEARINALAATTSRLVAGTDVGAFVSDDAGSTWRPTPLSTPGAVRVQSLATLGNTLLAGTARNGVLTSTNAGLTWLPPANTAHPGPRNVRSLLATDGLVYAGTDSQGAFRSDDGGRTWTQRSKGLPDAAQVFDLAVVGPSLFAALYSRGLYRLDPAHDRWSRVGTAEPLALAAADGTLILGHNPGGIHRLADPGLSWPPPTGDVPNEAPVWAMAADRTLALAGAADGIFLSRDKGQTWFRATGGLPPTCPGIAFLVTDSVVLAATSLREE